MNPKIWLIIGPTGIGKSDYALALAKKEGAEIISADAFQVYKGMDIGTAKVSKAIQAEIKHHLIDIKTPNEGYSVKEFLIRTEAIIGESKTPLVICGGTAFYTKAFLYGYTLETPASVPEIRAKLTALAKRQGVASLYQELKNKDPERAQKLAPTDETRIIRALEIIETTGQKASEFEPKSKSPRAGVTVIGLTADRDQLYQRINARVEGMYKAGLVEEVQGLAKTYGTQAPGFAAVGYKETIFYLGGGFSHSDMIDLVKQKSRNYAKHQLTWYRQFEQVQWINVSKTQTTQ